MKTIQTRQIHRLLNCKDYPCISIVLSTPNAAFNRALVQKTYKQLCKDLKDKLDKFSIPVLLKEHLVEKSESLLLDQNLWLNLEESLIIYLSNECLESFVLNTPVHDALHISDRFSLKYLLAHHFDDINFHVLQIQNHEVHLYSAHQHQLIEHCEEHFPQDILEVTEHKGLHYRIQAHSASSRQGQGHPQGFYTGAGETLDEAHQDLIRFYTAIDKILMRILKNSNDPLFCVGELNHMYVYKNISHYPNIHAQLFHPQNPSRTLKQLYLDCVQHLYLAHENDREKAIAMIGEGEQKKHSLVKMKYQDIVNAAHASNIETLLVWPEDHPHDNTDDDPIETLTREVYLNKGKVYEWVQTAALLRHPES